MIDMAQAEMIDTNRRGYIMKFSVQLSDKKIIKMVTANSFDNALETAIGHRFFSAFSNSYRRKGDVTTDKFFNVLVRDAIGTTKYIDGKKSIRLKTIFAQVSLEGGADEGETP